MTRLILIDNYDSFTYNLYQYLWELGAEVGVYRNDAITVDQIERAAPDGLVLSPGPGRPEQAGVCMDVIECLAGRLPILGVCLGHQAIAAVYGADIVGAPELRHGKTSQVFHNGRGLYEGMPDPFEAVRYHSLVAERSTLPNFLEVDAETSDGLVMGLKHRELALFGVQYHPESIVTEGGKTLLQNFLNVVGEGASSPPAAFSVAERR
jgi:anthranilate synthase/aminodeoxychorismate synthase-like glutamine amidotransferase